MVAADTAPAAARTAAPAERLFPRTGSEPVPRVGWAVAAAGAVYDDSAVVFLMASVSFYDQGQHPCLLLSYS